MEKAAGKLEQKAAKLEAKGKDGSRLAFKAAGLREGAAALRSDGFDANGEFDGTVATGLTQQQYEARGGSANGAARVPDRGREMLVNLGNKNAWNAGNAMTQWVVGHESLHTANYTDQRGSNGQFGYKFGDPAQQQSFKDLMGTLQADFNPDNIMSIVFPNMQ